MIRSSQASVISAVLLTASVARADVTVFNPSSGSKNDFHVTTDKAVKITNTKTGQPFVDPPPSPPFEYKSSGFTVGGAGSGMDSLTIKGLTIDSIANIAKAGKVRVLSWCWSVDGQCSPADPPYLKYDIKPGGGPESVSLDALTKAGFGVTIPEPAVWGMMILGFGCAGAVLRRRRVVAIG
jgi:hypothetical protein